MAGRAVRARGGPADCTEFPGHPRDSANGLRNLPRVPPFALSFENGADIKVARGAARSLLQEPGPGAVGVEGVHAR